MKSKPLLFLMFLCFSVNAQITDLKKISNGKLYDEVEIKDENNNIKGYFLLFETDKIAKETYTLEYVVLDENLTKVTKGTITEMKYNSWLVKADIVSVKVSIFNNKLLIQFSDNSDGLEFFKRYRILDLKTNILSDRFIFNKDKLNINPLFDRTLKNFNENQTFNIIGLNNIGLLVDKSKKDKYSDVKSLICYDENFNQKWKTDYNLEKTQFGYKELSLIKSNQDYIVFFNHYTKAGYKPTVSVMLFNAKTGVLNDEYFFPNQDSNAYKVVDCSINNNQVILFGNYSKKSQFGFISDEENIGLFKIILDAKSGKVIKETYNNWANMASKFAIDKYGYIKKEGNIFIHNMLELSNNKIIVVCEAFSSSPIKTNNIYFLELSKNLDLVQVFEIEKFRNKFPGVSAFYSYEIKKYGFFYFLDYQNMGDDEFLFYFNDNEKNTKNRKKSTIFGVVSYSNGKFNKQSLDLKTEISSINAFSAKKGYILLSENFDEKDKPTELRLEKINY